MSSEQEKLDGIVRRIRDKRRRIAAFITRFEPRGVRLMNLGIICGAVATALTAAPAIGGSRLTDALGTAGPNSPSWRILCGAAALFSLVATIATNLFKSHDIASRLARAQACDAKLEALEMLVELNQVSAKDAADRYEKYIPEISFIPPEYDSKISFFRKPQLDGVQGSIQTPSSNEVVETNFNCAGDTSGLKPGLHLWLAIEIDGRIWPKEGEINVQDDKSWSKMVFEEGAAEEFSLSLWAVNETGDKHIRNWFKVCDNAGNYPELRRTSDMLRLARINHLRRVKTTLHQEPSS